MLHGGYLIFKLLHLQNVKHLYFIVYPLIHCKEPLWEALCPLHGLTVKYTDKHFQLPIALCGHLKERDLNDLCMTWRLQMTCLVSTETQIGTSCIWRLASCYSAACLWNLFLQHGFNIYRTSLNFNLLYIWSESWELIKYLIWMVVTSFGFWF